MWMSGKEAADLVGVSRDAIERRAMPWQEDPIPFRVRFKLLQLDGATKPMRRYFKADVEALLRNPPRRDKGLCFSPRFNMCGTSPLQS